MLQLWREPYPGQRERSRLELVGLACEVAVVSGHMDEELAPVSENMRARELRDSCQAHHRVALELLAPETCFEDLSDAGLLHAIDAFRDRLREVMRLRSRVDGLLHGHDEWCSTFT